MIDLIVWLAKVIGLGLLCWGAVVLALVALGLLAAIASGIRRWLIDRHRQRRPAGLDWERFFAHLVRPADLAGELSKDARAEIAAAIRRELALQAGPRVVCRFQLPDCRQVALQLSPRLPGGRYCWTYLAHGETWTLLWRGAWDLCLLVRLWADQPGLAFDRTDAELVRRCAAHYLEQEGLVIP